MSLDKAIEHGKEKRKPYEGGKKYARGCRNHGHCSFCQGNRLHKFKKKEPIDVDKDYKGEQNE
jgi:hypothetical protein